MAMMAREDPMDPDPEGKSLASLDINLAEDEVWYGKSWSPVSMSYWAVKAQLEQVSLDNSMLENVERYFSAGAHGLMAGIFDTGRCTGAYLGVQAISSVARGDIEMAGLYAVGGAFIYGISDVLGTPARKLSRMMVAATRSEKIREEKRELGEQFAKKSLERRVRAHQQRCKRFLKSKQACTKTLPEITTATYDVNSMR